ncbi:MAG: S58 family peptidase [Candidatus Aenigmarchaeota archaeon]|nr:S58 family peptidase [Candidatus Aenigmarchaeota archaeon]
MNRRNFMKSTFIGLSLLPSRIPVETMLNDPQKENLYRNAPRRRIRELGVKIGSQEPGPYNAITDVKGVRVGQTTVIKGKGKEAVRTGVTVIIPHRDNIYEENLFASCFNLNGWGEMTGIAALENTGKLKTPIFLTGTYNVGIVCDAAVRYLSKTNPTMGEADEMVNPVVGECFDDFLSHTQSRRISEEDVLRAIEKAKSGPMAEGAVGGGAGMTSFGFKGGIGTSSRKVTDKYIVGVLVMANTGSRAQLRIDGVPVGKEIKGFKYKYRKTKSIILIAATDAPLLPFQLKKIAKRVAMGLAQTGAISHSGSGDIILAFSTANKIPRNKSSSFQNIKSINDFLITPLYQATVEATQEAIINALTSAETTVGRDNNTAYGIPLDQVKKIMKKYLRIGEKNHE